MARTALTPVEWTANSATALNAGANLDPTNGHVFTPTEPLEEYVIWVSHTTATEKDVTVKAGDNPPADAAGQGDLVTAFADGSSTAVVKFIGPLSSARFIQNDGTVNIDVEASATGKIAVYHLPATA